MSPVLLGSFVMSMELARYPFWKSVGSLRPSFGLANTVPVATSAATSAARLVHTLNCFMASDVRRRSYSRKTHRGGDTLSRVGRIQITSLLSRCARRVDKSPHTRRRSRARGPQRRGPESVANVKSSSTTSASPVSIHWAHVVERQSPRCHPTQRGVQRTRRHCRLRTRLERKRHEGSRLEPGMSTHAHPAPTCE